MVNARQNGISGGRKIRGHLLRVDAIGSKLLINFFQNRGNVEVGKTVILDHRFFRYAEAQ